MAESDVDARLRTCYSCGDPPATVKCKLCKPCDGSRKRIIRVADCDDEIAKSWTSMQDKRAIVAKARGLYGESLLKMLRTTLTEEHTSEVSLQISGAGNFLDEEDIRDKYKARPRRLEAILKNAKRMMCPITKLELIEDIVFTSVASQSESHTSTNTRVVEGDEKIPKPKVKKAKVESDVGPDKAPTLPQGQLNHLNKYEAEVSETFKNIAGVFEQIKQSIEGNGWAANVPKYIHDAHEAILVSKAEFDATVELIKESHLGEWKSVQADVSALKDAAKDLLRRTLSLIHI